MLKRWQLIGGVAILCMASAAWAQPGGGPKGGGGKGGGPGGFQPFMPPQPGEILPAFLQDALKLTDEQKKQLADAQKDVDAKLSKILTADQKKTLENMRPGKGGFGPPGGGPGGFPGGGGPGGAVPPGGVPGGMPGGKGFGPPGGFGGGFGGFGRTDDVQKKIGATDEEWKVIGPKLQKLTAARRAMSGDVGPVANAGLAQAQAELKTVLDDAKHTKAQVDEKIASVRKAREKARTELDEAQRDLIRLLTPTQQAIMVSLGHLD
jgi:hypothetical protein